MNREKLYLSTIDPHAGELARRYGVGIEITDYCTAWNMDTHLQETDCRVRQTVDGVERRVLHAPFNELFPCAIDPQAKELASRRYTQAVELAKRYGAKKVVIHGGYQPYMYYPEWYTEQSVRFWKDFLQTDPGVEIVLENVLEPTPEMLLSIVQAVDDPRLRLCLDVGHVNAYSQIPALAWVEQWAPCLSHLHMHNNDGTWDTHSPLAQGSLPIWQIFDTVETLCPEATFTLELSDGKTSLQQLLEADNGM